MSGPAPIVKVELIEDEWTALCESRGLSPVPVRFTPFCHPEGGKRVFGQADYEANRITVYLARDEYSTDRYRDIHHDIIITLLHELQHFWQRANWSDEEIRKDHKIPYEIRPSERDAEIWATENEKQHKGVVKISRRFVGNGFSRLGRKR